jgi:hypothetical protein
MCLEVWGSLTGVLRTYMHPVQDAGGILIQKMRQEGTHGPNRVPAQHSRRQVDAELR